MKLVIARSDSGIYTSTIDHYKPGEWTSPYFDSLHLIPDGLVERWQEARSLAQRLENEISTYDANGNRVCLHPNTECQDVCYCFCPRCYSN